MTDATNATTPTDATWQCLICGCHFELRGSEPRLQLSEITLTLGHRSLSLPPPPGSVYSRIGACPDCVREHRAQFVQLERDGFREDAP